MTDIKNNINKRHKNLHQRWQLLLEEDVRCRRLQQHIAANTANTRDNFFMHGSAHICFRLK